ncbi:hypothetical protein C942_01828 [Photobacterium marinum]|uniref:Uncharacterized protein n=1 Tax=Photobacterium marinum TaxID=1056511 RepID=L8J912_9GAMM|nr:hypothetical protein C942_01828 [Photobacterium marinum]
MFAQESLIDKAWLSSSQRQLGETKTGFIQRTRALKCS